MQLLDDFGESQEELFGRLMEIRGEQQRTELVEVPDSAEQVELQANFQETTNTPNFAEEEMDRAEPQPPACPPTAALATVESNEPAQLDPTTQKEVDAMETTTTSTQGQGGQPSDDAATNNTPVPDQNIRAEPSIVDILEAE